MIRREYSALERRAVSQIYNGAERYDFAPFFLAMRPGGEPELYVNTLIGLAVKWLDAARLSAFFTSYESNVRSEDLDVISWLGLENALYEKEIGQRPILKQLREEYASQFFTSHQTLSRQQMMTMNVRLYEQREARWAEVCHHTMPVMTKEAKELCQALKLSGDLDTEGIIKALENIMRTYFHVLDFKADSSHRSISETLSSFLKKVMYRETHETDALLVRQSGTSYETGGKERRLERGRHVSVHTEKDKAYIESCFGKSLISETERKILERDLCRDHHAYCHLYLAGAAISQEECKDEESRKFQKEVEKQAAKNRKYLSAQGAKASSAIHTLKARLDVLLATYDEPLEDKSREGKLKGDRCWRMGILQDPYVFTKASAEKEHRLKVDLLLDASASRLNVQEIIAAETWILVQSLNELHIPVRVMTFRSLRGYTVLQRLKDYHEKQADGILNYYAAGWNRDGLALRTMGRLIREEGNLVSYQQSRVSDGYEHLLFILTDANPDDSTPIPAEGNLSLDRPYEDSDAVEDTAQEVKKLRLSGIHTMAVYLGASAHADNVHEIYGTSFVSVKNIEALASGISALLEKSLIRVQK